MIKTPNITGGANTEEIKMHYIENNGSNLKTNKKSNTPVSLYMSFTNNIVTESKIPKSENNN